MANVRKYILIPEYKPLYAMRKCFGPTHGPLAKPCPTPIDIIGELLKQKETVTIHEVKKIEEGVFSDPIQLTLDNYMKSYDEIVAGDSNTDVSGSDEEVVAPAVAEAVAETVSAPDPEIIHSVNTVQYNDNDCVIRSDVTSTSIDESSISVATDTSSDAEEATDEAVAGAADTKRMTKAERRAARRNGNQ